MTSEKIKRMLDARYQQNGFGIAPASAGGVMLVLHPDLEKIQH